MKQTNIEYPVVLQHCFGGRGTGGPRAQLEKILKVSSHSYFTLIQEKKSRFLGIDVFLKSIFEIIKIRPDIIHVRGLGNEAFVAAIAAKICRVPNIILSIHGSRRDLINRKPVRRFLEVIILEFATLKLADHIVCVSKSMNQRQFLDKFRSKIFPVIPNGVFVNSYNRIYHPIDFKSSAEPVQILVVSRVTEDKGFEVLYRALTKLSSQSITRFKVTVVGDDSAGLLIKHKYMSQSSFECEFVGKVNHVEKYYRSSDIFLLPSLHENFSNVIVEAMSYCLPIVASNVGDNEYALGDCGLLYERYDVDALATNIHTLIENKDLRERLGREAMLRVRDRFSIESVVNAWEELYINVSKKL